MRGLIIIVVFALTGCSGSSFDAPEIKGCEDYILAKLKAPSSYKRISVTSVKVPYDKPVKLSVDVEYDAVNAFNAPLRDHQICEYPIKDGSADTSNYIDFDSEFDEQAIADTDNVAAAAFDSATNALSEDSSDTFDNSEIIGDGIRDE